MNPNNDKTFRGIFTPETPNDVWNDTLEYRNKFEKSNKFILDNKSQVYILDIFKHMTIDTIIHDKNDSINDYPSVFLALCEESKIVRNYIYLNSYGLSNENRCDCCGTFINLLNSKYHCICDKCDSRMNYENEYENNALKNYMQI